MKWIMLSATLTGSYEILVLSGNLIREWVSILQVSNEFVVLHEPLHDPKTTLLGQLLKRIHTKNQLLLQR